MDSMPEDEYPSNESRKEYLARIVKLISPDIRAQILQGSSSPAINVAFKIAMEQDSENQQQQKALLLGVKRNLEPRSQLLVEGHDNDAIVRSYLSYEEDKIPLILYERCHRFGENIPLWYLTDQNLEASRHSQSRIFQEIHNKDIPLQSDRDYLIEDGDYLELSRRWIKLCSDSEHHKRYASIPMSESELEDRIISLNHYHSIAQNMLEDASTNWSKRTAISYSTHVRKLLYFSYSANYKFDSSKVSNLLLQHVEKVLTKDYHNPQKNPNSYWTVRIKAEEGRNFRH